MVIRWKTMEHVGSTALNSICAPFPGLLTVGQHEWLSMLPFRYTAKPLRGKASNVFRDDGFIINFTTAMPLNEAIPRKRGSLGAGTLPTQSSPGQSAKALTMCSASAELRHRRDINLP